MAKLLASNLLDYPLLANSLDSMIPARHRLRRTLQKNLPDLAAAALGRLPSFLYGGSLGRTLPIFVYHVVDKASFEADLAFLRAGGYRTAGAAELERFARAGRPPLPRTVALTFDDGHTTLTTIAAPLLRAYGFRGLAYVVAGLVPDRSDDGLSGWEELCAAVAGGAIEVGAHSLFHHHVPTAPDVIGVVDATTPTGFQANVPIPRIPGDAAIHSGQPILRGQPRYLARSAFRPAARALERWAESGGTVPIAGTHETEVEADEAVVDDMQRSLALVRARCPNPADTHLCYPWYAADDRTDRLAGSAGVRVVYGGVQARTRGGDGQRPPRFQRFSSVFLRCLPGPGRRPMPGVLARNIATGLVRSVAPGLARRE